MLTLMAECIDIKRWRLLMFEWIERSIRDKIIKEIEDYRVETCKCDSELKPNCEALLDVIKIIKKELK